MPEAGYRGQLEVKVTDGNGNVFIYDTPNTVTYGIKKALAHTLVGDTSYIITRMSLGTGSTPPTRDDTWLENSVYEVSGLSFTQTQLGFPLEDIGQVQFQVSLGYSHPTNGNMLREVGLITDNGILVARQIHMPVIKTAANKVEYRWRIVFT